MKAYIYCGLMLLAALPGPARAGPLKWMSANQDAVSALARAGDDVPLANVYETYLPGGQMAIYMDDAGSCGSAGCSMATFIRTTMGWKNTGNWSCSCRLEIKGDLLTIDGDHGWAIDPLYGYYKPENMSDAGMFWMPNIRTDRLWN